ncbi:MAG: cadherin-like domain-containing protein, partial [Sulfurimonas sp.]|nr:cadherin-like domain-containing protein [Sulfurimonas sp.]
VILTLAGKTFLDAGNTLPNVELTVTDGTSSANGTGTITTDLTNDAPTVVLSNTIITLSEGTYSERTKVADITIMDDGLGTNILALTGDDAAMFEIVGNELFLRAGTVLDYESANKVLDVNVTVDDITIGSTPDNSAPLTINVSNVNEAPVAYNNNDRVIISSGNTPDTTSGNVITDSYQGKIDTAGDEDSTLTGVTYNGVAHTNFDVNGNLTLNAEYGDITFKTNGDYTYTYTGSDSLVTGGSTVAQWEGINLYGYQGDSLFGADDNYTTSGKLNIASLAAHTNQVSENSRGIGVKDSGFIYNNSIDGNDALVLEFETNIADVALQFNDTALFSLFPTVEWSTFDSDGNLVSGGSTSNFFSFFGTNDQSIQIESADFKYLVIESHGLFDHNYLSKVSYTPAVDTTQILTETFIYQISDSDGDTSSANLDINLNGSVITVSTYSTDTHSFIEDQAQGILTASGNLTNTLADGMIGAFQTTAIASGNALGSLTIGTDGAWTYNVNNDNLQSLAQDEVHVDTFIVTTADGSDSHVIRINITGVNDAPTISNVDIGSTLEDTSVTITQAQLLALSTDIDGDTLVITGVTVDSEKGSVVANSDGTFTFVPVHNYSGNDILLSFTVNDGTTTVNGTAVIDVTPVADAIVESSDINIQIGDNQPLLLDFSTITSLNGLSSYAFSNGITISTSTTFSYSNGLLLGVGGSQSDGGSRIAGNESIDFTFPAGMQSMSLKLKNAADDTVKITTELDIENITNSISGTVTSTGGTFDSTHMKVELLYSDSTGAHTIGATVGSGGSWNISIPGSTTLSTITNAKIITSLDGDLFNQGGNTSANVSFSINTDMKNLSIAQDSTEIYSSSQTNNGFQIEYVSINPNSDGSTNYTYPIDIYAKIQDIIGNPETFSSLKLSDFPSGSVISVVLSDGSYDEITAINGEYDLSAYSTLLNSATSSTFVDKIYLITSTPVEDTFVPTMTVGITDGDSTSYSIIGGTAGSVLSGGDGNDYISGGGGNDTLNGAAGNDALVLDITDTLVDGGVGYDTLLVETSIDFSALNDNLIKNIEEINLGNGAQDISLSLNDVMSITDEDNILYVTGDAEDSVSLKTTDNWSASAAQSQAGFNEYTSTIDPTVKLQIQDDIEVKYS